MSADSPSQPEPGASSSPANRPSAGIRRMRRVCASAAASVRWSALAARWLNRIRGGVADRGPRARRRRGSRAASEHCVGGERGKRMQLEAVRVPARDTVRPERHLRIGPRRVGRRAEETARVGPRGERTGAAQPPRDAHRGTRTHAPHAVVQRHRLPAADDDAGPVVVAAGSRRRPEGRRRPESTARPAPARRRRPSAAGSAAC